MTYFVFVFHVVTLAILLMPIHQLYFQISNCNVVVYVTLAYVFQISIVTVLNCNVSCHRVSLKNTLQKKGRAFRNIGKYTSLTLKSALHFFKIICNAINARLLNRHLQCRVEVEPRLTRNSSLPVNLPNHPVLPTRKRFKKHHPLNSCPYANSSIF